MKLCVVHLVWAPLGNGPLERFVDSYRAHEAGIDHSLLVVFNGFSDERPPLETLEGLVFEPLHLTEPMIDLAAYGTAAESVQATHLCFLNSYSELLADGWLEKLCRHLSTPGVGLVGATGSYERSAARPLGRIVGRSRLVPFPNPHIRTNAFMIPRELLLGLEWGEIREKAAAWQFETGRQSMTRQVWRRGLEALVVARDGEAYPEERWYESRTFRSGDQENVLVADNRTREYAEADEATRRWLAELAWGPDVIGGRSLPSRARNVGVRARRLVARTRSSRPRVC
ncbi:MAG: hypothetical protein WBB74_06520 [Gaiellaceae bacterium]